MISYIYNLKGLYIEMKKIILFTIIVSNILFASVAIIKSTTGTVEIKRAKKVLVAKKGNSLENGDVIITKAKSAVGIIFDDGTRVSLGEKTIFLIKAFNVDPSKKKYNVDLHLKKGKAVFSSGKVGKLAPESVKFRIPDGIIGIRGTKFAVEVK